MRRKLTRARWLAILPVLLTLGCTDPAAGTFPLTTLEPWTLDLVVLDEGVPSKGVLVQLRAMFREAPRVPEAGMESWSEADEAAVLWRGRTGLDGRVQSVLPFPASVDDVELLVTAPGRSGPFTDESVRAEMGAFAPAALLTVRRRDLRGLTVSLVVEEAR